ncbi:transglutaminase-like domain-containing protein [uncultured Pseudoalteromonas sp.]|uniref:transglutaminase-like domain-containing protein n=1 Tax=uncultured Pseudoalteromonas sp. TaxID=114053 RepID=UPI00259A609C|nr:transglutaminase-like domain-containing protein [uncultured Pseudoalteromonas sp.]
MKYLTIVFVTIFLSGCGENELVACLEDPNQAKEQLSLYSNDSIEEVIEAVRADQKYGKCFIEKLDIPKEANLREKAQVVLDFTSGVIEYAPDKKEAKLTDIDRPGTRLPSRTIADGKGDCEDKAALSAVMLRELGFKTYVIVRPPEFDGIGHVFLGVKANYETKLKCGNEYVVAFDPTLNNAKVGDEEYGLSEVKNASCTSI